MLITFFAIIYKPLNLQRPFQKSEVRDSECLVYYRGKIERFFLFLCLFRRAFCEAGRDPGSVNFATI